MKLPLVWKIVLYFGLIGWSILATVRFDWYVLICEGDKTFQASLSLGCSSAPCRDIDTSAQQYATNVKL